MLVQSVLTGAVRGGTSILYATVGETITERAGVINLGVEGSMLCGAPGRIRRRNRHRQPVGGSGGRRARRGGPGSMVHAGLVLGRHANQLATGLVVIFLGVGVTAMFGQSYVGQGVVAFSTWPVPVLHSHPLRRTDPVRARPAHLPLLLLRPAGLVVPLPHPLGPAWSAARASGPRCSTPSGRHRPGSSTSPSWPAGRSPGLGGAQLSTSQALNWFENMTDGRGFVAVALVIFATWNPFKVIGGAYLFGGAVALELQLQARGWQISPFVLDALPYLLVIAVLAALGRRRLHAAPEELDQVFETSS